MDCKAQDNCSAPQSPLLTSLGGTPSPLNESLPTTSDTLAMNTETLMDFRPHDTSGAVSGQTQSEPTLLKRSDDAHSDNQQNKWTTINRSQEKRRKRSQRTHRLYENQLQRPQEESYTKIFVIKFPGKKI